MPVSRFDSAGAIVKKAALELGLGATTAAFGSEEAAIQQLCALLVSCGRELALTYDWPQLRVEYEFTAVAPDPLKTAEYVLPADFNGLIVRSGFDLTNAYPLYGALPAHLWRAIKVASSLGPLEAAFRLDAPVLRFAVDPAEGTKFVVEYKSKAWVIPSAKVSNNAYKTLGATDGASEPVEDGDLCLFDPLLLLRYVKLAFRTAKGLDTTAELNAFMGTLSRTVERAGPGPVLYLNKKRSFGLIGGEGTPYEGPVLPTIPGLDSPLDEGGVA